MKTEFLKSLGIDDQEVINKIMAENGKDINKVRGDNDNLNSQLEDLKNQIADRDKQLTDLKKTVKGNEDLERQIAELQEQNKTAQSNFDNKINEMVKGNAIEIALRDANAKNVKAVKPFLDMDLIKVDGESVIGLKEQIEKLSKDETTSFLFGENSNSTPPTGTKPNSGNTTPANQGSTTDLRQALANAFKK